MLYRTDRAEEHRALLLSSSDIDYGSATSYIRLRYYRPHIRH